MAVCGCCGCCGETGCGAGAFFAIAANAERMDAASCGFAGTEFKGGPAKILGGLSDRLPLIVNVEEFVGSGGGVPDGVVDSFCNFCRNSAMVSSGKVFDRSQMSNSFLILSYNSHSVWRSYIEKGGKENR